MQSNIVCSQKINKNFFSPVLTQYNDGYDSSNGSALNDNIIIPFKNMINDSYSRDSSVKIRSQLEIKRQKGDFIGAFAAFGYRKSDSNRNVLVIDELAAQTVKNIFKWKIEGMSQQGIANKLNELGILSPLEYKRSLGERYKTIFKMKQQALWSAVAVRRILTNELYTGVLEQGKKSTPNYKIKSSTTKAKEEWIRVENTHEPIISRADFIKVTQLMEHTTRVSPLVDKVYPFSGLIYCSDCMENMIRKTVPSNGKKYYYFTCSTNRLNKNSCTTHNISEQSLEDAVLRATNIHIKSVLDVEHILNYIETLPYKKEEVQKLDVQIIKDKEELEKLERYKLSSYEHFVDKVIGRDEYNSHVARYNSKIQKIEESMKKRQKEIEEIIENSVITNQWIESYKEHKEIERLTRKVVTTLIDSIRIHENGKIDICFKYMAQYESAVSFIESAVNSKLINDSMISQEVQ